jgi:protein-S-isoprenylcysteine O-methyltransferase Ste14
MIVRFIPLLGMVLFLALGFVWRSWLQYKRTGNAGIILFHSMRWPQLVRDALFMILLAAMTGQAVAAALWPASLERMLLMPSPAGLGLAAASMLLLGGIAWMLLAQLRLGASWRIGIEEGASPGLIIGGCYRFCRNPIFLGMFITLAGMALLSPTWLSLLVLVGSIVCVHFQVLEEESWLTATYGAAYRAYAHRVGRFVPKLGLLAD